MEINISTELVDVKAAAVKAIDEKITTVKGTASEVKAAAIVAIRSTDDNPFTDLDDLESKIEALKAQRDDIKAACDEAVTGYLKAHKSTVGTELDALKVQRATLVEDIGNLVKVLNSLGLEVAMPDLGSAPRTSSNGTRTVRTGTATYSYQREGQTDVTVPCDAQQSLSSIAARVFDKAPVKDVKAALEAQGLDLAKDYSATITVNGKTATVSMTVTPEAPSAE